MRGAAQPASDSDSISSRSRSAGRTVGSRRSAATASCCSGVKAIRITPPVYNNHGRELSHLLLPKAPLQKVVVELPGCQIIWWSKRFLEQRDPLIRSLQYR